MWFMYMLSWIALLIQICLVTLAIAAGLFYIAELVEEYTVLTGRVIKYLLIFTTVIYIGLFLFEELDTSLIVAGLIGNGAFYALLQSFPYFVLSSPSFIASVIMVVVNHYLAFSFFAKIWYPFSDVMAFFTICLWLVPFAFFVSLSANENVLPTMAENRTKSEDTADVVSNYFRKKTKGLGLLSFLKKAQDTVLPQRVRKQY